VRYLILSDLHGNWEALDAVLRESEGRYDSVLCCGDLVGYGADPNTVTEWARNNCAQVVRGNHDKACTGLDDLDWFNPVAKAAALWTQQALEPSNAGYVRSLPRGPLIAGPCELVHGSPSDEDEYVLSADQAGSAFQYLRNSVAFFGHTHVQGGFWLRGKTVEPVPGVARKSERQIVELERGRAYMLNPGSVGQPRDRDPRAAFAIYDSNAEVVTYWRVPYDIVSAQRKIIAAGLPPALAERLAIGK
jgi:predicted phosphodiesterase